MLNKKTITVIKRELNAHLLSKSFIIMTLLVPVFMIGILGIQTAIQSFGGESSASIVVASESGDIIARVKNELDKQDIVKSGYYKISYETLTGKELQDFINKNKKEIIDEKLTGIVYIPQSAVKDKEIYFYAKNPKNRSLFDNLKGQINTVLMDTYFRDKQLSEADVKFATESVGFKEFKVSENEAIKEEGYGNMAFAFLFTFLLYFSLIIFGSQIMQAVIEEKNNRIIEVLLSSLSSRDLLTGKILGNAVTGLLQMAIWLLPVFLIISTTIFALPANFALSISIPELFYFLINYFIALVTFMGLYAAVGSIFSNAQDAQSGMWPVLMLIMIPFFIAIGMASNPNNNIARIASMVPFASLIIMPARITIMSVPLWQFILAICVNIATMLAIFPVAGKVYRVGILSTGKKPKWSEVVKWVKYKY